jgi:carbamoyl-phosphate synthase large subunit
MRLLVTSLTRPPAYSVATALRGRCEKVFGTMSIPPGWLARASTRIEEIFHLPYPQRGAADGSADALTAEGYVQRLIELCQEQRIDAVFPCQDEEIELLSRERARLDRAGIFAVANDWEVLRGAMDKAHVARVAEQVGFPGPRTIELQATSEARSAAREIGFPLVLKASPASAAAGVRWIEGEDALLRELDELAPRYPKILLQEHIPGNRERSFNVILDHSGRDIVSFGLRKFRYVHPSWSTAVEVIRPEPPLARAVELVRELGLVGFSAVQTKIDARDGRYRLIEVNPRFGNISRVLFRLGVNLPEICLDLALRRPVTAGTLPVGKVAVSLFDDLFAFFVYCKHRRGAGEAAASAAQRHNLPPSLWRMLRSYVHVYARRPSIDDYSAALLADPLFAVGFLKAVLRLETTPPAHWRYFIPWGEIE